MSAPRDFIAQAVAVGSGNPVLERIRDEGSSAVMAVYRLVKTALLHAIENQAVSQTIEQSHAVLTAFSTMAGGPATITYVGDTIFVCGQLLRASRGVYQSAIELGSLLSRCGVSEVSFDPGVSEADLTAFASIAAGAMRDPQRRDALLAAKIANIALRPVDIGLQRREESSDAPIREQILRFYASALVVMRSFYDALAAGSLLFPHRVKRLAQRLVTLAETGDASLLGLTAMANAHRDDAGRAVQAALLSIAIGRQLTSERVPLARLAMMALLADAGRVRLVGKAGRDRLVPLENAVDDMVPPATAAACISLGGVNEPSAQRIVATYESTYLERQERLGEPYSGRMQPFVQARILQVARALLDCLAPRSASAPMAPLDALEALVKDRKLDPLIVRVLVSALGLVPIGSVLELETGEWAVVIGASDNPRAIDRPVVRVVTDKTGRVFSEPPEIDLGAPPEGRRYPNITRVVPPKEARFNVTHVFVGSS